MPGEIEALTWSGDCEEAIFMAASVILGWREDVLVFFVGDAPKLKPAQQQHSHQQHDAHRGPERQAASTAGQPFSDFRLGVNRVLGGVCAAYL